MARRNRARTEPPAAEQPPVASVGEVASAPRVDIVIRAGHRHRGVVHDGVTPYTATPEEIALLRRYDAVVEG